MGTSTKPSVFNNEKDPLIEDNNVDLDELKAFLDQGNAGPKSGFGNSGGNQRNIPVGLNDNRYL